MARKIIIGEILNLIKGLGGNPNKFMGTKTNISFLGKGPRESLFQGALDIEGMMKSGFPLNKVIAESEKAGGYVTSGKLNDLQLQRLRDNLAELKQAYKPEQLANITDMASGTRDLTQEGLGSLREAERRFPAEARQFMGRPLKDKDFAEIDRLVAEGKLPRNISDQLAGAEGVEASETILPTGGLMGRIEGQMEKIKNASKRITELEAEKAAMYKPKPIDEVQNFTKSKEDIVQDLVDRKFGKGYFDKIDKLVAEGKIPPGSQSLGYRNPERYGPAEPGSIGAKAIDESIEAYPGLKFFEGTELAEKTHSARATLLRMLDMTPTGKEGVGVTLREVLSPKELKNVLEGGGGAAGDPIALIAKYFGPVVAKNIPSPGTPKVIEEFIKKVMRLKDRQGRGVEDPFFSRTEIDFAHGGLARILNI